jgi:hypothetical protein
MHTTYILILKSGAVQMFQSYADLFNAFTAEYQYSPLKANMQEGTTLYYQGV